MRHDRALPSGKTALAPLTAQANTPQGHAGTAAPSVHDASLNNINHPSSQTTQGAAHANPPQPQNTDTSYQNQAQPALRPDTATVHTPPIWQGRARHGDYAEVLSRNPDGTFQVIIQGQEKTRTERDIAYMTGLKKPELYDMLGQATQQHLARARAPAGTAPTPPPIWQGRARRGDYAEVLSRNPDGTFQVIIQGQEKTRTERDIAYMTGLKKPELYEMLGKATKGRLQGEVSNVKYLPGNGVELLPKTENSSFYKTDRTAESRSAADRASENRSLLDARPPRRHPPSDHMHLLITDAHGLAIQKAMILVDHAHDDGELSPVRVSHRVDHSGALGAYRWAHGIYWAEIGVSRDTAYPLMTTVHEIGHHIRLHLDPNEVAKVAAVARQSEAAATCINFGMDVDYWLSDSELFSRIYAQWVIKRSNEGEAARELDSILNGADFWQQFGNADWRLIQPVMDSLMKKKGWL